MWWIAARQSQLGWDCFRSPDTPEILAAVASGAMSSQPINTTSYANLEAMVVRLTRDDGAPVLDSIVQQRKAVAAVWSQLRQQYPQSTFLG